MHRFARERFDLNLDGKVTRKEFGAALRAWFDTYDGNKNEIPEKGDYGLPSSSGFET